MATQTLPKLCHGPTSTLVRRIPGASRAGSVRSASSYAGPSRGRHDSRHALVERPAPPGPAFYTARPNFNHLIEDLTKTVRSMSHELRKSYLIPRNPKAKLLTYVPGRHDIPSVSWKTPAQMTDVISEGPHPPKTLDYRQLVALLNRLNECRNVAIADMRRRIRRPHEAPRLILDSRKARTPPKSSQSIYTDLTLILEPWVRANSALPDVGVLDDGMPGQSSVREKPALPTSFGKMDKEGRIYALGGRKESSARVWIYPNHDPEFVEKAVLQNAQDQEEFERIVPVREAPAIRIEEPAPHRKGAQKKKAAAAAVKVILPPQISPAFKPPRTNFEDPVAVLPPISQILINGAPLYQYFANTVDREKVSFPLKASGLLGRFNVFVLVRGGGLSGQSGAIANGLARCLRTVSKPVDHILKQYNLIRRDPRMVERKKPGQPKARKKYAWVKR